MIGKLIDLCAKHRWREQEHDDDQRDDGGFLDQRMLGPRDPPDLRPVPVT
jgi:hypothetical protein